MPAQIGSLFVNLSANVMPFAQGMARAEQVTSSSVSRIRRDAGIAEKSVQGFWNTAGRSSFRPYSLIAVSRAFDNAADRAGLLRGAILATTGVFGGFTAALSSNLVLRYADSYTKLSNQLRVVSADSGDLAARFSAIEAVSRRSRSSLEATAILYSRIQKASPDRSADEILRYTETIQKALTLGGATAQEARSAAIQFSQAIASNRLGGEELRAILETPLGLELARGLGVTLGKFREMGHAGQLTSDVVLGALQKIGSQIDNQFAKSVLTLDQAIIHVDNSLTSYIGRLNDAFGGTHILSRAIVSFGDNLDRIIPTITAIVGLLGAMAVARNRALVGGLLGAGAGVFVGDQIGGLEGALVGGALGGLAGFKGVNFAKDADGGNLGLLASLRASSKATQAEIAELSSRLADLRSKYGDAKNEALKFGNALKTFSDQEKLQFAKRSFVSELERAQFAGAGVPTQDQLTRIETARAAALADAQETLRNKFTGTMTVLRTYDGEIKRVEGDLGQLAKSTTFVGQAKDFLRRQAGALVGLFGGPWGLAITGAIVGLSILGIRSQEAAKKAADARRIIDEALEKSAGGGDTAAAKSVLDRQIENQEERLKTVRATVEEIRTSLFNSFQYLVGVGSNIPLLDRREAFETVKLELIGLVDQLFAGTLSVEDFKQKVDEVGNRDAIFRNIANEALGAANKVNDAALATNVLAKGMESLRQQSGAAPSQRFAPAGAFASFQKERTLSTNEVLADLDARISVAKLSAQGLTAEAKAQEIVNKAREEGKYVDEEAILAKVKLLDQLEKEASGFKKAAGAAETLIQRISRLRAESTGAFLPVEADRAVLQQARELKLAAKDIEAYVNAVRSGDMSGAPPLLLDLRTIELANSAADATRQILAEYGNWTQIAPLARAKQEELDLAVANGVITAQQAKIAYADFLGTFGNTEWVTQVSDTIGGFLKEAILNFDDLTGSAANFLGRLADIILQLLVIEPIVQRLRSGFGSFASGGGILGLIGGLFGGGVANTTGYAINPWSSAGIFGSALGNIFSKGKAIAFAAGGALRNSIVGQPTYFPMSQGRTGVLGEAGWEAIMPLARGPGGDLGVRMHGGMMDGGGYADNRVYNIDARGAQRGVGQEIVDAIEAYDRQLPDRMQQIAAHPRKR